MTGAFQRNPAIVALAALAALLAAALAVELAVTGRHAEDAPARRAVAAEAKLLPPLAPVVPEQAYAETAARPLFVPTRRPAPELAAATAPAFQRGQFTLQGVIVVGDSRTALLREKANGRIHRLEAGKDVNGVKVLQIDPTVVTIGMGDEREALPLSVQRAAGAQPAPGGAPAQAAVGQGPFAPAAPASPFPQPTGAPPVFPPRMPPGAQPPGAQPPGNVPFPTGPQVSPANPPAIPGAAAPAGTPGVADAAPMSPEELLARRRARRAQQNQ